MKNYRKSIKLDRKLMDSEDGKTNWSQPEEHFLIRKIIRKIVVFGAQIFIGN